MNTKVLFSIVTNFTFNGIKRLRNPHLGDKFYMHTEELTLSYVPKCLWHKSDTRPTFLHSFPAMLLSQTQVHKCQARH